MKNAKLISLLISAVLILLSFNPHTKTLSPSYLVSGLYGVTGYNCSKAQIFLSSEELKKFEQYKLILCNKASLLIKKMNTGNK